MNFKHALLSLFCFFGISLFSVTYAQDIVGEFANDLKTTSLSINASFPVVNSAKDETAIFLVDSRKIYGYLLDNQFNVVQSVSSDKTKTKFKTLIGNTISKDNDYRLYLVNNANTKFAVAKYSFDTKEAIFSELDFDFKKQLFLQSLSTKSYFYIISVTKFSSILNFHTFDTEGNYKLQKIDLSNERFVNAEAKKTRLHNLLYAYDLRKIRGNTPNALEATASKQKLYVSDNEKELTLSLDHNRNFTQFININLETMDYRISQIQKPLSLTSSTFKKSNSYIYKDKIFLIGATNKKMEFIVQQYPEGNILKTYNLDVNDSISFKNSPIIQEGGAYNSYREMEKTRKFLRKISSGDIGISTYALGEKYQITLGGTLLMASGGGMPMMMPGFGLPIGSLGGVSFFFNPTHFAFNTYGNTRSTYINCVFNQDFEHVKGDALKNAFDEIKAYTNEQTNINAETIFKHKDNFILGYFSNRTKTYQLRIFKEL